MACTCLEGSLGGLILSASGKGVSGALGREFSLKIVRSAHTMQGFPLTHIPLGHQPCLAYTYLQMACRPRTKFFFQNFEMLWVSVAVNTLAALVVPPVIASIATLHPMSHAHDLPLHHKSQRIMDEVRHYV